MLITIQILGSLLVLAPTGYWLYKIYRPVSQYKFELVFLLIVLIFTSITYLTRISEITPGAHGDEITIGLAAQDIVTQSRFVPFIPVNLGHPTILLYLTGFIFQTLGPSLVTLRLSSVIFGVATTAVFYLLLRRFVSGQSAEVTSVLFGLSYPMIILSRLAYEMTAALFFFVSAFLFLQLSWSLRQNPVRWWLIASSGILTGWGLSTYVGFRLLAVVLLVIVVVIGWQQKKLKAASLIIILFLSAVVLSSASLLNYAANHLTEFWQRTYSVSVFHQNLPAGEVAREIMASAGNVFKMFCSGDPNFRHNPTSKPMFDFLTTTAALAGLLYLLRKPSTRILGATTLILALLTLLNDLFTIELIPDFRYYGQGHPNTLRVFAFIPFMYFWVAFAWEWLRQHCSNQRLYFMIMLSAASLAVLVNLVWYFDQSPRSLAYLYNYQVNRAQEVTAAKLTHQLPDGSTVFVSQSLLKSSHFSLLQNPALTIASLEDAPEPANLSSNQGLLVVRTDVEDELFDSFTEYQKGRSASSVKLLLSPQGEADLVLIFPRTQ